MKITYLGLVEEGEEVLPPYAAGNPVSEDHAIGLDVHRYVHGIRSVNCQVMRALALSIVHGLVAFPHGGGRQVGD